MGDQAQLLQNIYFGEGYVKILALGGLPYPCPSERLKTPNWS